jgi:hypothetical protein
MNHPMIGVPKFEFRIWERSWEIMKNVWNCHLLHFSKYGWFSLRK